MGAPYKIQGVLLHGLRIDADTIHTVVFHNTQFPFCYGVRPSCFHGKFPKMGQVKMFLDLLQKSLQRSFVQCGRRSASNIQRLYLITVFFYVFCSKCDLMEKCFQIPVDLRFLHLVGCEGTI